MAIAEELRAGLHGLTDVRVLDVLALGSIRPSADSLAESFTGPAAGFYDAVWSSPKGGTLARAISTPALAWAYRRFTEYLLETRPDAVICTHALAAILTARAIKSGHIHTRLICVTTDFGVHGFWPRDEPALTCVASDGVRANLIERGFAPERVAATGIPVRTQFSLGYDRRAIRARLGIPPSHRVVLALAGATVAGPYSHLRDALLTGLPVIASTPDTSLIIITGNDHALAEQLQTQARRSSLSNVRVMAYIDQMAELMAASDLVVAKPGGLVCAESLSMNLPLLLVGPAAGQERANANVLSGAGVALFASHPQETARLLLTSLNDERRLAGMRTAARRFSRPFAAADVAERVLCAVHA